MVLLPSFYSTSWDGMTLYLYLENLGQEYKNQGKGEKMNQLECNNHGKREKNHAAERQFHVSKTYWTLLVVKALTAT